MASALNGGKTSPRLLEDLKLYNPQRLPNSQFNVLTSLPIPFSGQPLPRLVGKGACQHEWKLKPNQASVHDTNVAPKNNLREVGVVCGRCRCHLKLQLRFPTSDVYYQPCPQPDHPLHHFVYDSAGSHGFSRSPTRPKYEEWEAQENFRCTVDSCKAEVTVQTRSPRLQKEWVDLLTNEETIKLRAEAAIATDRPRFEGHAIPRSLQVLLSLRLYITNAITRTDDTQKINASNKRWMLCFGDSCGELLDFLGFQKVGDEWWIPPRPEITSSLPLEKPYNILLDDVLQELVVLMRPQDEHDQRSVPADITLIPATKDLQQLLGCLDYEMKPGSQPLDLTEEDEHPYFAGLGSVINFHDSLLIYAYDRQQNRDPSNSPYYLQCLQGIAKGRKSEALHTKSAIEESSGKVSLDDIRSAYIALGFDGFSPVDEETVIGTFKSRISDAPRQESELRRCLRIIGGHMNSKRIEDYAADTVNTYEQALAWLGATAEMGDDFITSMFSLKLNENPTNIEMARHCVHVIAKTRKSDGLLGFLDTGELRETEMSAESAYEYLVNGNRDAEDDLILSHYTAALNDSPSQKHELDRALRAIAKARNSHILLGMSGSEHKDTITHNLSEWPIGLENIGNTCYLNSLLQFFFTIKPLRSLVLNNQKYVMDINDATIEKKKVGSRHVTRREIERAQQFLKELGVFFDEMITTPKSQITPKLELARLTMLSTFAEEGLRRQSILSDSKPTLTLLNPPDRPSPLSPSDQVVLVDSPMVDLTPNDKNLNDITREAREPDGSSEGTLVEAAEDETAMETQKSVKSIPQMPVFEDKENVAPHHEESERPITPEHELRPLAEASPSRVNRDPNGAESEIATGTGDAMEIVTIEPPAPPNRPPPVPPRSRTERRTTINEEELYRQQDVTEVIGNVLFQLQCAIKPDEIDASGEQIDLIKKLFYGKMKTTTTDAAGKPRTMEEFFSDLKLNVSSGPLDLYSALDSLFDQRMVELGSSEQSHEEAQFSTITALPEVLQIHPIRTAFDRQSGAYKLNHQFVFDEVIYLDRYMDGGDKQTQTKRARCWEMKDQLKRIEERHIELGKNKLGLTASETLSLTADYLLQVDAAVGADVLPETSPTLIEKVRQAELDIKEELVALASEEENLRKELQAAWADESFRHIPYRLHAVFIHRGMVSSGHYWVYIYDHPHDVWRKYNDGYVTQVDDPASEIFGIQPGDRPATPMFFVYVAQAREARLVEAVRRELPEDYPPAASSTAEIQPEALKRAVTSSEGGRASDEAPQQLGKGGTW